MMFTRMIFYAVASFAILTTPAVANDYAKSSKLKGYHISSIVEQWGQPNYVRGNRYHWKECRYTGYVITNCHYGNCRSHRETTCCNQYITTDKEGVITRYSEKGTGYCFNSVNYSQLSQHRHYAKNMYGYLGVSDGDKPYSIQVDKKTAQQHVQEDCKGQCKKIYEFHNSCISNATPNQYKGKKQPASAYYVSVHKNLNTAMKNALQQCEKVHGKGNCHNTIWDDTGKHGICALDYR